MRDYRLFVGLGLLFAGYLGVAGRVPPADDELYYWCWSRDLQPSYFDHPPLVAYLIRASTAAFGHSLVAVRLPAVVASVVVVGVLARLGASRFLLPAVLVSPLFTTGAVLVTPDTPLLLSWALYLAWLTAVHRRLDAGRTVPALLWVLGGSLLGAGLLGKYTMALAGPAGLASFALGRVGWRVWLRGYALHAAVAAGMFAPVVWFNLGCDFAPLKYQWNHATTGGDGWTPLGEFLGSQAVLVGVLPLVLLPWAIANLRRLGRDPATRAAVCLYALPLALFLAKACRGPLEANWALAAYLGFWPVAAKWLDGAAWRRRAAVAGFAPSAATALVLGVHVAYPFGWIPPGADRVTRQAAKFEMARAVADAARAEAGSPAVYALSYQWTAALRFHGADARQIAGATRPSHFTAAAATLTDARPLVFAEGPLRPEFVPGRGLPTVLRSFPLVVRGRTVGEYRLMRYDRPVARGAAE